MMLHMQSMSRQELDEHLERLDEELAGNLARHRSILIEMRYLSEVINRRERHGVDDGHKD